MQHNKWEDNTTQYNRQSVQHSNRETVQQTQREDVQQTRREDYTTEQLGGLHSAMQQA